MNMLAYIAPALFLFTIHIAMQSFQTDVIMPTLKELKLLESEKLTSINQIFIYVVDFLYILIFLSLVFFSIHLTYRHPKFKSFIYATSTLYGILAIVVLIVFTFDIVKGFLRDD